MGYSSLLIHARGIKNQFKWNEENRGNIMAANQALPLLTKMKHAYTKAVSGKFITRNL